MWGQDPDYTGTYYVASNYRNPTTGIHIYDSSTPANNYYLCPTEGWYYYKATDDFYPSNTADENKTMPFLTTFKCKGGSYHNDDPSDAKWTITKHGDYYSFQQTSTGKYMVFSGQIKTTTNADRMRVHLETVSGDLPDNALFSIATHTDGVSIIISPISILTDHLTVNGGNSDYLIGKKNDGQDDKMGGPSNAITNGIIGIYRNNKTDDAKYFYLEDVITRPTITYNSSNLIEITAPGSTAIYYTTNGTKPTASSGILYEGPFDPADGVTIIKAIAIVGGEESNVATYEPPFLLGSTHKYIIQSKQCQSYRLIPNTSINETTKYVSSLNVPCETMAWHFEYAEEGYYYIVDNNGWYLYYTTTDNSNKYVYLKSSKDDSDDYKFSITAHASGGFNLKPKGQTTPVYKANYGGSNAGLTPARLAGSVGDATSRWDLIPYSAANLPQWADAPFTNVSDNNHTYYYQIVSFSQPTKPIILNNDGVIKSQTIPDGIDERKTMWIIKDAGTSGLLHFYSFENAYTGEKLYYNGNGRKATTATLQLGMPDAAGASEQWSHFVIVQTETGYNIIPRSIVDNTKAISTSGSNEAFNCINRYNGSDVLGTYYDDGGGSRWTFSQVDFCMPPVFEESNGSITISCATNGSEIHYQTTDDSDPTSASTLYNNDTWNSTDTVRVKAIAIVKDGETVTASSAVSTLLNMPDITLSANSYTYDGSAKEPTVSEVSIGESLNKTSATTGFATTYSPDHTNAGSPKVFVTDNVNDNLYILHAEKEFTINPAPVTLTANSGTESYDGMEKTVSGYTSSVDGLTFTGVSATGSGTNVGEYDVTFTGVTVNTTRDNTNNYVVTGTTNGKLTINPGSVTLTANSGTETYDGTEKTVSDFTSSVSGLTFTGVSATGSGTNAGEYDVTFTGVTVNTTRDNTNNYIVTGTTDGKLTINKRQVTISGITASDKTYDGTTTATVDCSQAVVTGMIEGDVLTVTSGTGTFDTKDVGTDKTVTLSSVSFEGEKAGNYEMASSGQQATTTASITPAALTVTANNHTIIYGDAPANNGVTYSGFVNSETEAVLGGTLTYTYNYEQFDHVSDGDHSYTITPDGLTATNYDIIYAYGTLTVNQKPIGDETNPADGFTVSIGEGNSLIVKDGETTLTENDITVTNNGSSLRYSTRRVAGKCNYSGYFTVRNAIANFQNDGNGGTEYSATFVAENADGPNDSKNGHALPSGITAYIITSISGNVANAVALNYIPQGVPVVLLSNAASGGFLVEDEDESEHTPITSDQKNNNMLEEVTTSTPDYNDDEETDHYQTAHFNARTIYLLSHNEFVHNMDGYLDKGKVYLNPNHNSGGGGGGGGSRLFINWDETTSIENYPPSTIHHPLSSKWYTLDGRRLSGKPTQKGLYLRNGEKMVVR